LKLDLREIIARQAVFSPGVESKPRIEYAISKRQKSD
jgi:hypothetical protein